MFTNHFVIVNIESVLMASMIVQMCFGGSWESLGNGCMEYKNGKNTVFFIRKDSTFDEFIARVYEVLQINSDEYHITIKTVLKSNCPTQPAASLPIDILDNEMVRVIKHMNSDPLKYGYTPIFVTISPKIITSLRSQIIRV